MLTSEVLVAEAPAKINLGLRILSRRSDGYHEIETGLIAVDWCDKITVGLADSISMTCSDRHLPTDNRNLCVQVAAELKRRYKLGMGVHIHLEKQVPVGAGLGGGSSDAATTIRLLSKLWSLELSAKEQLEIAKSIGSDVPFFVDGRPAIGRGRGEKLSVLRLPPILSDLWVGIVTPDIEILTADAYARVSVSKAGRGLPSTILSRNNINTWNSDLINDFEESIFVDFPDLAVIKESLRLNGSMYSSLSGSGAAIFALFDSQQQAGKAIKNVGLRAWIGKLKC